MKNIPIINRNGIFFPGTMERRNDTKLYLFQQYSEVANVIKSVYTLAHSLNNTLNKDDWQEYPNFWNKLVSSFVEGEFYSGRN